MPRSPLQTLREIASSPLRLPQLGPQKPRAGDPAILGFNAERDAIVADVVARVVAQEKGEEAIALALNDAAYHEARRLSSQRDTEAAMMLPHWKRLVRQLGKMNESELRTELREIVTSYTRDVAGNFDPRVYGWSESVVPRLLTAVMRPTSLPLAMRPGEGARVIDSLLQVQGDVEMLRRLEKQGTLVYVPTHSSNLDSIVLGRALQVSRLSPVVYGAGKNLFTNPIISFFMHNLGAYRVDRRIHARLYKDVLKTYSQVMIERGYHSLFFPGGTRSRSNLIETHLKLGLAGSAVNAFATNRSRGIEKNVYFVPTTINYELVLEAETLIDDWLQAEGKARYIITDDEFSRFDRWIAFFRKLIALSGASIIHFGAPLDPFGNPVDRGGRSLTPQGRAIDPGTYVQRSGIAVEDLARDAAFTRDLGDALVERYPRDTVLMPTALVAHVLFRELVHATPKMDLFSRLRIRGEIEIEHAALVQKVGFARDRLRALEEEGVVLLSALLRESEPAALIARALDLWGGYHTKVAITDLGDEVRIEDASLLLYYQNRLAPFALAIAPDSLREAASEIELMRSMS